jgi:hypothetical protein
MEKYFPLWKFFHAMENFFRIFPYYGKLVSTPWKMPPSALPIGQGGLAQAAGLPGCFLGLNMHLGY